MVNVKSLSRIPRARPLVIATATAALIVLAGASGYEVGISRTPAQNMPVQAHGTLQPTPAGQEAPPVNGLQP